MPAIDTLITSLNASEKIPATTKTLLTQFLQAAAPTLNSLESTALEDLMLWLSLSTPTAPPAVDQLTPEQVSALLTVTQSEMSQLADDHLKSLAAARTAVNNLANTALSVLMQLLISAL